MKYPLYKSCRHLSADVSTPETQKKQLTESLFQPAEKYSENEYQRKNSL